MGKTNHQCPNWRPGCFRVSRSTFRFPDRPTASQPISTQIRFPTRNRPLAGKEIQMILFRLGVKTQESFIFSAFEHPCESTTVTVTGKLMIMPHTQAPLCPAAVFASRIYVSLLTGGAGDAFRSGPVLAWWPATNPHARRDWVLGPPSPLTVSRSALRNPSTPDFSDMLHTNEHLPLHHDVLDSALCRGACQPAKPT